jgi:glycosyltransferase involved in cell wall biosynthesis
VIRWSKEAGYQRVFTVEPVTAFSEPSEYVTGRVPVDPTDWPIEFRLKMLGAYRWLAPVFEWRDQIRGKLGNRSRITTGNLARTRIQSAFKAAAQNSLLNEERRDDELVTAVIPTRNRPDMLLRAVRSALNQDYRHLEVVVVVDGPDPATNSVLQSISDPRLRVVSLPEPQGGSAARNAGVLAAHGAWIAFLDDDDEWLPSKISKQIECARMSRAKRPIVSCQLIARTRGKELIWPRKTPSHPVSEYLLSRSSWSYGEGILSTITLFMPRSLLLEVPFTLGLPRYQDLEWILRALDRPGVSIEFISEPLAIWHMADGLNSVSSALNLDFSLNWIRSHRERVTQRAYSGFIATQVAPQAARQNRWKTFFPLLLDMFRNGRPTSFHIALYLSMWFTPHWLRRYVRLAQR